MKHDCKWEQTIPRIEKKLDDALKFKFLLTGGTIAVIFLCGVLWELLKFFQ